MTSDGSLLGTECPECVRLRRDLDAALACIALLEAQVRELLAQLQRNSSNSSTPPSANPLGAPKPVVKTPTGRKPGGQRGHKGYHRLRLPPERVNTIVPYVPMVCEHCQAPLSAGPGPGDPEPTWHQVAELPVLAAVITEHQGHARTCPCCGCVNRAQIPPEIRAHVIGPRLAAAMSYFTSRHHVGRRGVEEIVETVFEVPTSLGSIITLEAETREALASPYHEAQEAVRQAPVKNTDETGWSEKGQKRWLWGAATATVAFFVIHLRRNFEGLQALLGETIHGIVCSDRWSVYSKLPLELRQICWAHLKRDFQKLIDRGGSAEAIGRAGLEVVECLFADWWTFRRGELDRPGLQSRLDPIARTPRRFGAGLLLRGFQGGDLLRQRLDPVPGVVVVHGDRGGRAHKQPCRTHPADGRFVAEERLRLPQRGGMPVRGADADRRTNAAAAETAGAGIPVSCDRGASGRSSRSATTGPSWGLNGYKNDSSLSAGEPRSG